jgi:hypothetical protein
MAVVGMSYAGQYSFTSVLLSGQKPILGVLTTTFQRVETCDMSDTATVCKLS